MSRATETEGPTVIFPVGMVLDNGWVVASLRRYPRFKGLAAKATYLIDAICPECFGPDQIAPNDVPLRCKFCTFSKPRPGVGKVKAVHDPDRWRSLAPEAAVAFAEDFRYAEEMALFLAMAEYGKSIQAERNGL